MPNRAGVADDVRATMRSMSAMFSDGIGGVCIGFPARQRLLGALG